MQTIQTTQTTQTIQTGPKDREEQRIRKTRSDRRIDGQGTHKSENARSQATATNRQGHPSFDAMGQKRKAEKGAERQVANTPNTRSFAPTHKERQRKKSERPSLLPFPSVPPSLFFLRPPSPPARPPTLTRQLPASRE